MKKAISADFAQSLGQRLTELRKELELHQSHMAQKMCISERVYRRYESGEQVPGSDKLKSLLDDLKDLNPAWLLTGKDLMFKSSEESRRRELALDLIGNNQSIERIVIMLKGLEEEDLQSILFYIGEKKKFRDMHLELRSMAKKLERPETAHGSQGRTE
jgi:transcriptional regulator with XRE-family HTH domain